MGETYRRFVRLNDGHAVVIYAQKTKNETSKISFGKVLFLWYNVALRLQEDTTKALSFKAT